MSSGSPIVRSSMQRLTGAAIFVSIALAGIAWWDSDARTWVLWWNTARLAVGVLLGAIPLGTFLALLIHRGWVPGSRIAWSVLIALLFIPLYIYAAGWDAWLGRQGWVWPAQDFENRRLAAAIFIHTAAAIPWVAVIVGAGLRQLDPELEEAAWLQMSPAAVLARVTIPLSAPAILLAGWWVAAQVLSEITVTDLYQVRTYGEEVYSTIPLLDDSGSSTVGGATLPRGLWAVAAWLAASLAMITSLAGRDLTMSVRGPLAIDFGRTRAPATLAMGVIVLMIAAVPLVNLIQDAGQYVERTDNVLVPRWSLLKCVAMVGSSPWTFRRELFWTGMISGLSATSAMTLAIPLAWSARRLSLSAVPALAATSIAAAVPGPLIALAIIVMLNRPESDFLVWLYDRTILAPVLSSTIRALPVAILISWWGCRTVPQELLDASRLEGLGTFGLLYRVVFPIRRKVWFAAWLAALAIAASDLSASLLVTPPGISTITVRIFGLLHAGVDDQVGGICLVIVCFSVLLALTFQHRLCAALDEDA